MSVYKAINAVQADLALVGISKDRTNTAQGYKFRGIDDIYNAVSPMMAKHGLCILPRAVSRSCVERTNAKGTSLFYVTVEVEFDFVAASDGSTHIVRAYGEAMDSGDKATNKAMSAAYKYAVMQAFAIPTEGDNDADAHTHEIKPGMPPQTVETWARNIEASISLDAARKITSDAMEAAKSLGDAKAHAELRAAGVARAAKFAESTQ